jgi:peptide deformylase
LTFRAGPVKLGSVEDGAPIVTHRRALFLALLACGTAPWACSEVDEPGGEDDGGLESADGATDPGGEADGEAPGDEAGVDDSSWPPVVVNEFIESFEPPAGDGIALNRKIRVVFRAASDPAAGIDSATVFFLVNDAEVVAAPYWAAGAGNREFRVVPFPFWQADTAHTVRILAGAAYIDHPEEAMPEDAWWTFRTAPGPVAEDFDPDGTAPLAAAEIELIHAGAERRYLAANLVRDWEDPASGLYAISTPVDPADPEVRTMADKMKASLLWLGAIGIAAPQVGVGRRLFVADVGGGAQEFINPRVASYATDEVYVGANEGCLSVPDLQARVARPRWIVVEYDSLDAGRVADLRLEDYNAKVWLHEYDHLNGILMTDRQQDRP